MVPMNEASSAIIITRRIASVSPEAPSICCVFAINGKWKTDKVPRDIGEGGHVFDSLTRINSYQ